MLKLRLLTGPRAGRQLRVSDTKPVSVGRRKGRLRLHDSRVSKHHADIYFENDAWMLRDLGSTNGTYVNRKKAEGLIELESGDMVQMGRVLMKIVRCDGIGMDTQPALPDELLDDALGLGPDGEMSGAGDDDFDLDALFNDSPESASDDALGDLREADEPAAAEADDELDDAADEPVPEPLEVAFDEPVDDDDSFFADLSEATDTSDGVDIAIQSEQLEPPQPEADPFLGGEEEQEDEPADTSDQISLDDESGMGPSSAGTTLLTTVSHDDLVIDEDDASSGALFDVDESSQVVDEGEGGIEDEAEGGIEDEGEDADDPAPALVGLHLDHAPPQQPEAAPDEEEAPTLVQEDQAQTQAEVASAAGEQDEIDQAPELHDITQELEHTPDFDIDAAFDALSEGLDDSPEMPAIDGESDASEKAPADATYEPADEPQAPDAPESLVGSQLDVGFIQDALSKLEEAEAAEQESPADDASPKASAAPAPTPEMSPNALPVPPSMQHPPPGINPSSLSPSTGPQQDDPPRDAGPGMGRWFVLLLLFLSVGGVGGWLISQNYDKLIAGRDDFGSANPTPPAAPPSAATPTIGQPGTTDATPANPADPTRTVGEQPDPTASTPPPSTDPFAAGPGVLGSDALQGITRDSDPNRPLDPPQPPSITNPAEPAPIVQPPLTPGTTNPTTKPTNNPTVTAPQAVVPGDDTTPVVDEPPARIVFLIDASGSLVDSLPQMVVWLNEALQTVEADERFAVYYFKADKPITIKPAGMLQPSRELLNMLGEDWLNPDAVPVFPSGRSNPAKAIAQAMSHKPTDLYLLSDDAFAMHAGGTTSAQAIDLVTQAIGDNNVRVHGVQFFYRSDNSVLEALANQTDGTFEFVREHIVPDSDPIDLLEELGGE